MPEAFVDKRGNRVEIGDILVVGFRAGSAADVRVGRVVAFTDQAHPYSSERQPLIEMEWEEAKAGRHSFAPKTSKIYADNGRFVILEKAKPEFVVDGSIDPRHIKASDLDVGYVVSGKIEARHLYPSLYPDKSSE